MRSRARGSFGKPGNLLGGSWVVLSGSIQKVTLIKPRFVHIYPRQKPPLTLQVGFRIWLLFRV